MTSVVIIIPFYSQISMVEVLPSYLVTTFWFVMVFIAGMTNLLSWFLLFVFITAAAILFSYEFLGTETLVTMLLGMMWALIITSDKNNEKAVKDSREAIDVNHE